MTYYSMVGGKDLSVPGVDLQCTCHFSIQVSSFTPVLSIYTCCVLYFTPVLPFTLVLYKTGVNLYLYCTLTIIKYGST